ncbi:VOC family protein [Paracoccus sp. SSJ]|uniref:VOC family protein n=1 Tax=Paracoccus sp. SSJ TaxID=3050636 RepID=UPI00254ADC25|nr:VOC family protein [Paracoccus sp. SSJ]MDK8874847.1 VOC family protein [Paracoccus sp. SSJ]
MSDFVSGISPLYVDHLAVTTAEFEPCLRDYLAMPGARISRGPGFNDQQKVRFAFVQLADGFRVEILGLPETGDSPIMAHVERGGGAYHLCYAVADIDASLERAQAAGARVVVPPKPDPAHDGRPVAFLIHPAHGLVELVAAWPTMAAPAAAPAKASPVPTAPAAPSSAEAQPELVAAFRTVLRKLSTEEVTEARFGDAPGWDSLAHLQLVMEVERRLGIRIPTREMGNLTSFAAFAAHVEKILA